VSQRTAAARPLQGCGSPHRSNHINLSVAVQRAKQAESRRVKYWETIADNHSKVGWSWGYVSALDSEGARYGSPTRIAATERVLLCGQRKS